MRQTSLQSSPAGSTRYSFCCILLSIIPHNGCFMLDQGSGRTRRAFLDQIPGREKEPGKLPDSFKIHLLKTVVKLQRLMAGSCDNVILLFFGQADELNSVTRYTDGEVSVLRLLRMSLCV